MPKQPKQKQPADTILHITLPTPDGGGISPERATATLLIQRGDLAHMRQFHYAGMLTDLTTAIRDASEALGLLEDNPPVIPELPAEKSKSTPKRKSKAMQKEVSDEEPTIDIPRKKGTHTIPMSHLKIVAGETDAVAYRIALQIAGRLLDGGLWDGEQPLYLKHVSDILQRIKAFTDKDFSLFTLADFAEIGEEE